MLLFFPSMSQGSKTAVPDSHQEGCIAQAATRSNVDSWKLDSDKLPRTVRLGFHFPGSLVTVKSQTCLPTKLSASKCRRTRERKDFCDRDSV